MQEHGRITLIHTETGWFARFSGQIAETIQQVFNTDTLPTAFTGSAKAGEVKRDIQIKWPRCVVEVQK